MSTLKKISNKKMMIMTLLSVGLGNFLIILIFKTRLLVDNKLFNNNPTAAAK
jgi:hypothetical protein